MTDDDAFELSRRKALAGIGTIGVASAGAGLGTSAFFSDTETFDGNSLTAGELDLIASWKEVAYQGGGGSNVDYFIDVADADLPTPGTDVTYEGTDYDVVKVYPGGTGTTTTDGPTNELPNLVVGIENLGDFEVNYVDEEIPTSGAALEDPCANRGEWVNGDADPPEIDLTDVKPGDFGEVTLDYHLCGNPGYVWLQGALGPTSEGDTPEPELGDVHEDADEGGSVVELLDAVQTRVWLDDGDNIYEPAARTGQSCNVLALDESGSIGAADRTAIRNGASQLVEASDGADDDGTLNIPTGLVTFDGSADPAHPLTTSESDILSEIAGTDANSNGEVYGDGSGATDLAGAIDEAVAMYQADANSGSPVCPQGADKYITLLTDGEDTVSGNQAVVDAADAARNAGIDVIVIGVDIPSQSFEDLLEDEVASKDAGMNPLFFGVDTAGIEDAFDQIERIIGAGEEEIFQGSLRELFEGDGGSWAGLNNIDGLPLDADTSSAEIDPQPNSNTRFVGFEWWVPPNGLNEIMDDSVTFDLGFYTEQARHNPGPNA